MPRSLNLPPDPAGRFREVYDALNAERGWSDAAPLRFAAVAAMTCPGSGSMVAGAIRQTAERIKAESGWFGPLRSHLRFIVAAILLQHDDDVSSFKAEVGRVRQIFREVGVRRDEIYETIAILILRIQHAQHPIKHATVERLKAMYEEMKRYHWWLTGPDDLPSCALLAGCDATPEVVGEHAEAIFQALRVVGFSAGNDLQSSASVLALCGATPDMVAQRCAGLAAGFREAAVQIWQSDYDELAILALVDRPAENVVRSVLEHREAMKTLKPRPDRMLTFNLACSITFVEMVGHKDFQLLTDVKSLMDMQTIIRARQAAAASGGA